MSAAIDREKLLAYLKGEMAWADSTTPMGVMLKSAVCGIILCKIELGEFDVEASS
jgi:hypothetical protein